MNSTMKIAVAFAAGLGLGVGGTYLYMKGVYEKEYEKEIMAIRDLYMSNNEDEKNTYEEALEAIAEEVNPVDDDEEEEEEDEDDEAPSETPDGIEEVDKAEFYDGYPDYEETCLTLYTDGVLTDECEDEIDPRMVFGNIDLQSYEVGDELYFVNHNDQMKIELTVSEQSYKRDVLGEGEEEEEVTGDFADKKHK